MENKKSKINTLLVLSIGSGILIVVILVILIGKIMGFGRNITKEEIDAQSSPENAEIQSYDYFIPLMADENETFPANDEKTTVVCLGNSPFSDDKDSETSTCNLFADNTGVTVYDCSIPGSYMSSLNQPYQLETNPMDAFSFYWLTTIFASDNKDWVEQAYRTMGDVPKEIKDSVEQLQSIDFDTVDAIFIMYDGSDYLDNHKVYSSDDFSAIETSGAYDYYIDSMTAGINLIKEKFPWIRIIVMSHPYAYGISEDGSYVSSDAKLNSWGVPLSVYFNKQAEITYQLEVSFVDNLFGGIHEEVASEYLKDNLHLNLDGRKLIASRMKEALESYTKIY